MKPKKTRIEYGILVGLLLLSFSTAPASFAGENVAVSPDNSNVVKKTPNQDAVRDLGMITGGVVISGAARYFEKARTLPVQFGKKARVLFTVKTGTISPRSRWSIVGIGSVLTSFGLLDLTFNNPKFSLGQKSELPSTSAADILKKEATRGLFANVPMPNRDEEMPSSLLVITPSLAEKVSRSAR